MIVLSPQVLCQYKRCRICNWSPSMTQGVVSHLITSLSFEGLQTACLCHFKWSYTDWSKPYRSFSQVSGGLPSTGSHLPARWSCPSRACLWSWTFSSDPILCAALSGNSRPTDVSDYWNCGNDCHKTRNRDLSVSVISQAWEVGNRTDLWPFIKITLNQLFIEVASNWEVQAQNQPSS